MRRLFLRIRRPPRSTLFPSTTLCRSELGNLIEPLSVLQVAGIWPAGDFRLDPEQLGITRLLVVVCVLTAIADRKSTRLNSSHANISYAVFCLKTNSVLRMTRAALVTD